MDRLDAMEAFVVTVEKGSLSAAARSLRRSAASVTRAVSALEERVGAPLLRRTTRSIKLTEAGERYLEVCRRVIADLAEADRVAVSGLDAPRGQLTITAPVMFGALHVRPVVDAYLAEHVARDGERGGVHVRLTLLDRLVNLVDEGIDVAVRIAHLPDSALLATKLGDVRRVACASPAYLARAGAPSDPRQLADHRTIAFTAVTPSDTWTFGPGKDGGRPRQVKVRPILAVNTADAAIGSAIDGHGIACALSYQVAGALAAGTLVRVLQPFEPAPLPVHLVVPVGGARAAKVRAFVDLAVPRLKAALLPRR